jgi:glycosyltransferase involved in cell wall biosynthesis
VTTRPSTAGALARVRAGRDEALPRRREAPADAAALGSIGRRHVLQLVDTLEMGGAERVAVNLANALPRDRYRISLGTTRRDGPLADLVAADVTRLRMNRRGRFDTRGLAALVRFVRAEQVDLVHAHGTAVFAAQLAARLSRQPAIVWHDHFGRYAVEERSRVLYRMATSGVAGVITVNHPLADWARQQLRIDPARVWYVPNFVTMASGGVATPPADLPGSPETRLVCVGNFRPQKDHLTLVAAMERVAAAVPSAHLLLVGELSDSACGRAVRQEIERRRLTAHVTVLGQRRDVPAILHACAIGVLSSSSEGLPLALIEYGAAALATVATDVGECGAVLDAGRAGRLVRPGAPTELGEALISLLRSPADRRRLGHRFRERVTAEYGAETGVRRVCDIYDSILEGCRRS